MREEVARTRKRETTAIERSYYYFLGFSFGVDSISEEVAGFNPLWFPRKIFEFIVSCVLLLCMLFSQIRS